MVMDKARWTCFQIILVGLQMNSTMQIALITLVQLAYIPRAVSSALSKLIFKHFGIRLKHVFQEVAILTFFVVLTVFAFL